MKQLRRTAGVLLLSVVMLFSGTACGKEPDFDASGYVKGYLDTCTKGDGATYASLCGVDTSETDALYESGIEDLTNAYLSGVTVSEESSQKVKDSLKNLIGQAKYTVSEAQKNEDGTYSVSVESDPLLITLSEKRMKKIGKKSFDIYYEKYETIGEKATNHDNNKDGIDYDKYYEIFAKQFVKYVNNMAKHPTYGAHTSITVTISAMDGKYAMSDEDQTNLFLSILETES